MIYVDKDFKCHATNPDGTLREVDTDFFPGKCQAFVEGYCYDDRDGYVRIYPWHPYEALDQEQREYERRQLEEAQTALGIILGEVS